MVFMINLIFGIGYPALFKHTNPSVKRPGGQDIIIVFTSVSDHSQVFIDLIKCFLILWGSGGYVGQKSETGVIVLGWVS